MSREFARRLTALERDRGDNRIRYLVSDRALTDSEWRASLSGELVDEEPASLNPVLTEAEWIAIYSEARRQLLA